MSKRDKTYECSHCHRSISCGCSCNCVGTKRFVVQAGHPDSPSVDMHSRESTKRDEAEIGPDEP